MRTRIALLWAIAALSMICPHTYAQASTAPSSTPPSDDRLNRLEQRLTDLEHKYQSDIQSRDEEIAQLKAAQSTSTTGTRPATPAATNAPGASSLPTQDEIEKTKQDVLKDIQTNQASPLTLRTPASFNPDMAVITDFKGNVSTNNSNPARNRLDVGSVELELRGAVDPRADAVAVIPISRGVDDPLFPEPGASSGDVNTSIEIEEAYLFLHDFGVPNLTAKLGRFHLQFGRWNQLHSHDWPTADNNFTTQSFLASEAITASGLSLSYVIPPKLVNDQYIEAVVQVVSGEGDDEQPVINNTAFTDTPTVNAHLLWNRDVARDWNLELGTSYLYGKHNDNGSDNANLFGGDVTLIHTDPTGGFFNQVVQSEMIYGVVETSPGQRQYAFGGWVLGQQQLDRDWYAGCRLDWTQNALDEKQEVWGISPYVSWYWSEFLRLRLEYQYKTGDTPTENNLYFQATWVFGAHPPHPYWSMK